MHNKKSESETWRTAGPLPTAYILYFILVMVSFLINIRHVVQCPTLRKTSKLAFLNFFGFTAVVQRVKKKQASSVYRR